MKTCYEYRPFECGRGDGFVCDVREGRTDEVIDDEGGLSMERTRVF